MKTFRTGAILVVVDLAALHRQNCFTVNNLGGNSSLGVRQSSFLISSKKILRLVQHRVGMNVHIGFANLLVCKEIAVRSNRKLIFFQEPVQLVNCTLARVAHEILHKCNHRLNGEAFFQHVDDAHSKTVVHFFIFPEKLIALDRHMTFAVLENSLFRFDKIPDGIPVVNLNRLHESVKRRMSRCNSVRLAVDNYSDVVALDDIRE